MVKWLDAKNEVKDWSKMVADRQIRIKLVWILLQRVPEHMQRSRFPSL